MPQPLSDSEDIGTPLLLWRRGRGMRFHDIIHGITQLFFPNLCEGCRRPLTGTESVLCMACALELPETHYHNIKENETAQRFEGRVAFEHATTLAYFTNDGLLQHLIHGLKYTNKKETGRYLGNLLGQRLKQTDWLKNIDLIIPVPLHNDREAERGYNQSILIAEGITSATGIPTRPDLLLRGRKTESQTKKTRTERVANMAGAFTVNHQECLKNMHILLCDDVLTTGATLESCALTLLAEESVKISIATIGIAVS